MQPINLPICAALPRLKETLASGSSAVLVAPPGAGKTTGVPLSILDEPWLGGRRILLLEPRRLAARGAANRMAESLGEEVGETIGIRARLATNVSAKTRIEVITEGVFTRMVLDNPELNGIGAVVFDEFHERSLDADLGLALALDVQAGLREDLRILIMSATLDGARVAKVLDGAPVITSEGRSFDVDTRYIGRDRNARTEEVMADAVIRALREETGSILVFLPGQSEIRRLQKRLEDRIDDPNIIIAPLYGAMEGADQDRAIRAPQAGKRKVVIATAIAESSLTIEGIRIVIDSGFARVPRYDAGAGVTRLETVRASRASVDQRRGRAGRLEPGVCYRLWDQPENKSLRPFEVPEMHSADLSGLVLDCAAWGVTDTQALRWLDPPTSAALSSAREELKDLVAIDQAGLLTSHGKSLRSLPLPPRLASMLLHAARLGQAEDAALIAAILVERGLGGKDVDLESRLRNLARDRTRRARDMRALAKRWAAQGGAAVKSEPEHPPSSVGARNTSALSGSPSSRTLAGLLALAFPDRIAKARGTPGSFVLANGRGGQLDADERLAGAEFLVVGELIGRAAASRIVLATEIKADELADIAGHRITEDRELSFDTETRSVRARQIRRLERIIIQSKPLVVPSNEASTQVLATGIAALGTQCLPWSKQNIHLRQRLAFLRGAGASNIPDFSDEQLTRSIDTWLVPFITGKTAVSDITVSDLEAALSAQLPWDIHQQLERETPTHFQAPTGIRHPIAYKGEGAPSVALRVQELFGIKMHPSLANGRVPLTLVLLSPADRPIQLTRDLPGFWAGSWRDVRADMKGRYPKHPWPDDPAHAVPTSRAKPRRG